MTENSSDTKEEFSSTENAGPKTHRRRTRLLLGALVLLVVVIAVTIPIVVISSVGGGKTKQPLVNDENTPKTTSNTLAPTSQPSTPPTKPPSPFRIPPAIDELDRKFVSMSLLAAELSYAVKGNEVLPKFPDALLFVDEPDAALVIQRNNTCFAAFRETKASLMDWAQNLDPGIAEDVCAATNHTNCCPARQGYRNAYANPSFRHEVEDEIRNCVAKCKSCEVIMTGSSQGGAVAQIAAVYMNDLKPAVISFGQPPTMKGTCDPLDESRMYRFINTIVNSNEEIRYDPVPFLYDPTGDLGQLGHAIVLGEDLDNVVYFRPDESYYVPSDKWAGGLTLIGVHGAGVYAEQLSRLNSNGTFPIGIAGWSLGFKCTIDEECESARCNQANKCVGKR